jgi:type II secretory pathway pseudopilin PulG
VEVMVAVAVFGIFSTVLLTSWTGMQTDAMNTTSYSIRQNEQMRVMDYIKRDIRRATEVTILDSSRVAVTGVNTYGSILQLKLPDYYSDTRVEDDAKGTSVANTPTYISKKVVYGTPITVEYSSSNGAVIRSGEGTPRTISDATGNFTVSFCKDSAGFISTRLIFDQRMRSASSRKLRRQVDFLADTRTQYFKTK